MTDYTVEELESHRYAWIAALRSGKYKQGQTYLKIFKESEGNYYYCCLGIACEIANVVEPTIFDDIIFDYGSYSSIIGDKTIAEYYGFKTPESSYDNGNRSLANDNDHHKYSFQQIADVIENHWDEIFTNNPEEVLLLK